jgi:hypothetical protein
MYKVSKHKVNIYKCIISVWYRKKIINVFVLEALIIALFIRNLKISSKLLSLLLHCQVPVYKNQRLPDLFSTLGSALF